MKILMSKFHNPHPVEGTKYSHIYKEILKITQKLELRCSD